MTTDALGLYIHIPFCIRKCRYCDFCSFTDVSEEDKHRYVTRLVREISSYKRDEPYRADTVFFGGGTPSLLAPRDFETILQALRDTFSVSADAEITVEANPKTLSKEKLACFRSCGVNRMSIGLQSINENEQKMLGRIHDSHDFFQSVDGVRAAGIDNLSVDIMYGIPEQTTTSFSRTVDAVLSVEPSHVSAYSLILEPGTPLYEERERLSLPDEDEELTMLDRLRERLSERSIERYEISNYSVKGAECRHNIKYWTMQPYIGFGLAAHSYFDGARFSNATELSAYMDANGPCERQVLSVEDEMYEYAMLHLRTVRGFSLSQYCERFGVDFIQGRREVLDTLRAMKYLDVQDGRLFLTDKGLYVSNRILTEIL